MMKLPNVSILIIARNEEKALPILFKSIERLNYPRSKLEIVYVDDGSTDGSLKIGKKYADKIFHFDKRQGRARVRNKALKLASNDLIAWIDSDCEIVDRNWIQNMLKHLKGKVIGVSGNQLPPREGLARVAYYLPELAVKIEKERYASWAPTTSSLFRKKPIIEVGGFDETLITAEDLELCWRLQKKGYKFKQIPQAEIIHNFRSSFKGLWKQQYERGIFGAQLTKQYGKGAYSLINLGIFVVPLMVALGFFFPILLLAYAISPLIVYFGLGYMRFFPSVVLDYLKNEKSLLGALELIALQYVRTFSLVAGVLAYQARRFVK